MQPAELDALAVSFHALGLVAIVVALAGIALDVDSYRDALCEHDEYRVGPIATILATAIALLAIDLMAIGWWTAGPIADYSLREAIISVSWTIVAAAMFCSGLRRRSEFLRWVALAIFGITLIKIPLVDLATIYRVGVLFAIGTAALLVSAVYLRGVHITHQPLETDVEEAVELTVRFVTSSSIARAHLS